MSVSMLEIQNELHNVFSPRLRAIEASNGEIYIKHSASAMEICGFWLSSATIDKVKKSVADGLVGGLKNALSRNGYNVDVDRKFFFDAHSSTAWKSRLTGNKAPILREFFDIQHESSPDDVYHCVTYKLRAEGVVSSPIFVFYKKDKGKIHIEDVGESPTYGSLMQRIISPNENIKLVITEGEKLGVVIDGKTGQIKIRSGMSKDMVCEVKVITDSPGRVVLQEGSVILKYVYTNNNPNTVHIRRQFFEYVIDVKDNIVNKTQSEMADSDTFEWMEDVRCPLDFQHNPYTAKSRLVHLVKDSEPNEPKYVTNTLWITSDNMIFGLAGGVWVHIPYPLEDIGMYETYIGADIAREIQRYKLSLTLLK